MDANTWAGGEAPECQKREGNRTHLIPVPHEKEKVGASTGKESSGERGRGKGGQGKT